MAVLATGALLWGLSAAPASADNVRDGQWALKNYGADTRVWPVSQGEGVTVAVVDSGVLADHQDLTGQIIPGTDIAGQGDGRTDPVGHGTQMAGIIAGHGHGDGNASGVMGLAPKAKILPVRISTSPEGKPLDGSEEVPKGIRYAVDHGARVINVSIGGGISGPQAREAISYAVSKDVVIVASTGNDGVPLVEFPAAIPGVVAVGAIDKTGAVWDKSNRGPETTVVAPGVDVYVATAKSTSSYGTAQGTSASTAYVSAIAALVRSKYPNLSAGQVINRITTSAVAPPDKSVVPNDKYGFGIASPEKALQANPAVDNGPKENPLLSRVDRKASENPATPAPSKSGAGAPPSQAASGGAGDGSSAADEGGSKGSGMLIAVGGGVVGLVVVVLVVVFLVRRSKRGGDGDGPGGGAGGAPGYGYAPQAQPGGYGAPQPPQGFPPAPGQQYPPQQPPGAPGSNNPYQR
ncbi:S8 family serine peptidase [Kitasatospora camelliae]|uniref:S8 family serine peptidase n=1 Tax=Kitasatospora camelliae TaxID=3156397 RepID=A0AAU8JX04_9ACTN